MSRLKLDIPVTLLFRTELPVRITDINYGGHLGNDSVLSLVHEARVRFLSSMGYSEMNVEGAAIIMADAQIVFRSESYYGDVLRADVGVGSAEGVSCEIFTVLTNVSTGTEVARAKTTLVFYDYAAKRPLAAPKAFLAKFG
jgi:acyl-CoA thioesterase FadM